MLRSSMISASLILIVCGYFIRGLRLITHEIETKTLERNEFDLKVCDCYDYAINNQFTTDMI